MEAGFQCINYKSLGPEYYVTLLNQTVCLLLLDYSLCLHSSSVSVAWVDDPLSPVTSDQPGCVWSSGSYNLRDRCLPWVGVFG